MAYNLQLYCGQDPTLNPYRNGFSKLNSELQLAKARFARRFIKKSDVVADVCCGSGFLSVLLRYKQYIGVEHPSMVSLIKTTNRYLNDKTVFVPFDFEDSERDLKLGLKVDVMLSFETIEHTTNPERFIYNLHKNLKQSGLLILSTPINPFNAPPNYQDHFKEYSLKEIHKLLNKGGFKIIADYVMGVPFGSLARLLKKQGINVHRAAISQKRERLARALDYLPFLRKLYCTPVPYNLAGVNIGQTGEGMIIIALKKS